MGPPVGPCHSFETHHAQISPSADISSLYAMLAFFGFRILVLLTSLLTDFIVIPLIFYIVVAAGRFDLVALRKGGWLFDVAATAHEPWYQFYTYLGTCTRFFGMMLCGSSLLVPDFRNVWFSVLWSTLPTQFALWVTLPFLLSLELTETWKDCSSTFCIRPSMFRHSVCKVW